MTYQSLEEQITTILDYLMLNEEEKQMLKQAYLNPGMNRCASSPKGASTEKLIQALSKKDLLVERECGEETNIYPIPLILLVQQHQSELSDKQRAKIFAMLRTIDKWIKYPLMKSGKTRLKSSQNQDTVIKWLFDLHASDWDHVYCFGDYEAFIASIGIEPEVEWINARTKKGRKASVVATKDGKWAQRIESCKNQELRDCLIEPGSFEDLFIMAFPDIHTTVMGSSDGQITFVQSDSVARQYAQLVNDSLKHQHV